MNFVHPRAQQQTSWLPQPQQPRVCLVPLPGETVALPSSLVRLMRLEYDALIRAYHTWCLIIRVLSKPKI